MKASAKNAGFAKALLLNHGEKIGMLIFGGAAAWLLYASLGAEGTDQKPGNLTDIVQTANSNISRFTAADAPDPAEDPEMAIAVADTWEAQAANAVDPKAYDSPTNFVWDAGVVPPIVLRRDPLLLPAVNLEGFGGTAPLATMDEATRKRRELEMLRKERENEKKRELEREANRTAEGDPGGRGGRGGRGAGRGGEFGGGEFGPGFRGGAGGVDDRRRQAPMVRRGGMGVALNGDEHVDLESYACVTAIVPVEDQWKLYKDAFSDALGYSSQRDMPKYLGYFVERMEVGSGAEGKWTPVKFKDPVKNQWLGVVSGASIQRSTQNWVPGMPPLVDGRYFHPELTFPLPPMAGKPFGREVVHSEVPLQMETDAKNANEEDLPVDEGPTGDTPADLLGGGGVDRGFGGEMGGRGFGGRPGGEYGGFSGRGYGGEFGGEMGGRGFGGEFGGEMGGRGFGGGRGGGRPGMGGGEFQITVPQVMVRFFDFSVQQGKRYRYRVQLLLEDPNADPMVSINHLDKEAKQRVEEQAKQKGTKFRKTDWSEPSKIISIPAAGEVYVASVKPAPTRTANGEPSVELLVKSYDIDENNRARQAEHIMPFNRGAVLNRTVDDIEILENGGRTLLTIDSFDFKTNMTLLDIEGGEKIGRDAAAPGRVLLMDASGRLFVQDEFSSKSEVDMHKLIFAEEERGPGGGEFRGGRGGGMDFGRGFEGMDF
ncbi:hypothetical protein KOR34_28700 [Posidoniimonas corsicana]|uniref:Uncharacterized protein n=1 Tax=Posidoniimonas corsicana TaxID=1938618 RepID=A0A5C5VH17_9BACT|nr:hypothetical protein [Posidoniimonas corsicana]TWT37904.1 hypothetical protein KOR34_28700 [Posidoniimonas corsicana]